MNLKQLFSLVALCILVSFAKGQNNLGVNTTTPHASAALDVTSTTQGMLVPRMSTTQRNAIISPANGLMVYDLTLNAFYFYDGVAWSPVGGNSNSGLGLFISNTISATNTNGNGTFYLNATGASPAETDAHRLLIAPVSKVVFSIIASGSLTSNYTLTLRRGTNNGSGFSYTDLSPTTVTLTGATMQTITLTGLTLQAGETLGVKCVGTASFATNAKSIFYSLIAQ